MNEKAKNFIAGLIACMLFATIGFVVFYAVKFNDYTFSEYLNLSTKNGMLPKILAICLMPNLIPFHFFLNKRNYRAVYGVLTGMLLWAVVIIWFKYVAV
ncbi:MAG: hypothetical protein KDC92_03830 [Bacteroidetes bacterium]|nr:hypothetical protein [Bacteroidota bacterium]